MPFSVSVICGADGLGGTSDCLDFIKVNKFYEGGAGQAKMLIIPESDESLKQNMPVLIEKILEYFQGTLTEEN